MFEILKIDFKNQPKEKFSLQLIESLKETGFAVIENPPINFSLIHELYDLWDTFFQTPTRFDFIYDPTIQAGYFPFASESAKTAKAPDLKEFFHFYTWYYRNNQIIKTMGPLRPLFSKTFQIFEEMENFGLYLLSSIESFIPKNITDTFYCPLAEMANTSRSTLLRILHYPAMTSKPNIEQTRAYEHEDINLITLLPTSTTPGLVVKDLDGAWHEVPFVEKSLVINVGDMLQKCTYNFFKATTHKVVEIGDSLTKSRYSMPLFIHPKDYIQLTPHLTAGDYLRQRLKQLGLLSDESWQLHQKTFSNYSSLQNVSI